MTFLDWLLRTSWQVALLVILILAAQRILGSRLSPRWRYALWWIVVLRLVLPPIDVAGVDLERSLIPDRRPETVSAIVAPAPAPVELVNNAPPPIVPVPAAEAPPSVEPVGVPKATGPVTSRENSPGVSIRLMLLFAWIAGAVGLALFTILREMRDASRLSYAAPIRYPEVPPLVDRCRAEAGMRRPIAVAVTDRTRVPALIGMFRPRLLLPPSTLDSLTPEELRYVIHHELEHVRHHDLFVNWLLQILLCMNWMNPFVWIAFARLRSDREVIRDLGVLARIEGTSGPAYGRIILRIVELAVPVRAPIARVAILETGKDVRRRITMLARYEGKAVRGAFAGAALAAILALFTTVAASQDLGGTPSPVDRDRPTVLVAGFSVSGDLLKRESDAASSLGALAEALLADHYQTASAAQLEDACDSIGCRVDDIARSADLRLAVAQELGGARCVSGWACSFGERIVLIAEVIDPSVGLPGKVHRVSCDGLEGIPAALEQLLGKAGLLEAAPQAETVEPLPDLPENDLLDTYPNDAWQQYLKLRETAAGSIDPRDRELLDKLLAEALVHAERLKEDRDYRDEWIIRLNVRRDPICSDYDWDVLRRGRYLMFVQKCGDKEALKHAARLGDVLQSYYQGFYELFGESLELSPLSDRGRGNERILRVLVVTKRDTFKQFPLPPGVDGFYSPNNQWLTMFVDEGKPIDAKRLTALRMKIVHEATHQLIHYLTKFALEEQRGEEVMFTDPALRPQRLWLSDGLADLMAGAMGEDGSLDLSRQNEPRRREWEMARRQKQVDWSLTELLTIKSRPDLMQRARRKGLTETPRLMSLFYAQATSFCHYLWNGEDARNREFLIDQLQRELACSPIRELVSTIDEGEKEWRASLE